MLKQRKVTRILSGLGALLLVTGITVQVFFPGKAFAAAQSIPTPRSLTLEAGTDPGAKAGGTVKHLFSFTVDGNNTGSYNVGSISFQYCTTADPVVGGIGCYVPPGLDLSSATISNETGTLKNFGATPVLSANSDNTTNGDTTTDPNYGIKNTMTIGLVSPASISAATTVVEEFNNIVNPNDTHCYAGTVPASNNCTFYVRIYAYAGIGGGALNQTAAEDYGVVAASTSTLINLTGFMPESLTFCTGGTIGLNAGNVPDCSTATSGDIGFDRLFSPTDTAQATSQMAASTNANNGYAITVNGGTLLNGSYSIAAMGTTGYSVQGTPQFGMNVVANPYFCGVAPECDMGADVTATGGTLYNGEALNGYSTGGGNCTTATPTAPVTQCAQFTYSDGATVADSLVGNNSTGASDAQIYTDSYIVNVPGSQPAGTYTTTLTYICTPTF